MRIAGDIGDRMRRGVRPARLPFFSHIIQRGVCPSEIIIYRPAADVPFRQGGDADCRIDGAAVCGVVLKGEKYGAVYESGTAFVQRSCCEFKYCGRRDRVSSFGKQNGGYGKLRPRRGCDLCYKRGQLGQYSAYGCEHYGRSRRIYLRQRNTLPSGICRRIGQGLCERCPPDIITYGR